MEFRQLRYFVAVAEELHFGRAAIRLNLTQPPLSRQISNLEDELGLQLFFRSKRNVELTSAGKEFLRYSYEILQKVEEAFESTRKMYEGKKGILHIGYASEMNEILMKLILLFRSKYPHIEVVLKQIYTTDLVEDLKNESIQIGVLPPFDNNQFNFKTISTSVYGVVLPKTHQLAKETKPLKAQFLKREPFIIPPRNSLYYDDIQSICRQAGFIPNIAQEVVGFSAILSCVASGLGISIVSKLSLEHNSNKEVLFRELVPHTTLQTSLVWHKDEKNAIIKNFINLTEELQEIPHIL